MVLQNQNHRNVLQKKGRSCFTSGMCVDILVNNPVMIENDEENLTLRTLKIKYNTRGDKTNTHVKSLSSLL
jgi:hypothetical protein